MVKTIQEICQSLETALLDGNINAIPENSLKIKQFLSRNTAAIAPQESTDYSELFKDPEDQKILVRTVENYMTFMSKLRTFDLNEVNDGSEQFEVLIGERSLPYVWDYLFDTVFIDSKYSYKDELINYLLKTKHENIFTFSNGSIFDLKNDRYVSLYDVKNHFIYSRRIFGSAFQFVSENQKAHEKFVDYMVATCREVGIHRNTVLKHSKAWHKNQRSGLEKRLSCLSHEHLRALLRNKNILLISPGPSLKHVIHQITEDTRKKFKIIAVAQSMPALAKFNLRPDFVMVTDPEDYSHVLDDWPDLSEIDLIAEETVHINFINKSFSNIFTVMTSKGVLGLNVAFGVDKLEMEGGTVSLNACSLAAELGARSITLVGQDLSISNGNYFVSGKLETREIIEQNNTKVAKRIRNLNGKTQVTYQELMPVLGWHKEELLTFPQYAAYLNEFESFAKDTTGISLFNTSVGGANIKGFQNINFTDLLGKLANPGCSHNHLIDQKQIDYNLFREFLLDGRKAIGETLRLIEKAINLLKRSKHSQKDKMKKLDKIENKLITISKKNKLINFVVSDAILRLEKAMLYVTDLEDNLDLSLNFYVELNMILKRHRQSLSHGLKLISKIYMYEDENR